MYAITYVRNGILYIAEFDTRAKTNYFWHLMKNTPGIENMKLFISKEKQSECLMKGAC